MRRQTRDSFAIRTQKDITSGNACLETPPQIFHAIQEDFGPFDIDLTADAIRYLLPIWFGPGSPLHVDALLAPWHEHGKSGYSNPPYGPFVPRILKKAKDEAKVGFASTFLIPLRATKAFHKHILNGATDLLFCDKRIAFWENGSPKLTFSKKTNTWEITPALFDSIIVRYAPGMRFSPPRVGTWKVPPHIAPMGW